MRRTLLTSLLAAAALTAPAAHAARPAPRPTARQVVATADRLGVGAQARKLQDRFLPAARLVSATGRGAIGGTRLGGAPDLPAAKRWPSCDHHPLTFLGQIALADLRAAIPGATRGTGLLSIFVGTRYAPDTAPEAAGLFDAHGLARVGRAKCFAVFHTAPGTHLARRRSPAGSTPFAGAPQRLRPTLTIPDSEVADERFGVPFDDDKVSTPWFALQARAAAGTLATPAGNVEPRQLLGWSQPIQEDPTHYRCAGQPSRLLLQLNSSKPYDLDKGEGGALMLMIGANDLRAGRFDRLCVEHQLS
jgi:hypothetical protein